MKLPRYSIFTPTPAGTSALDGLPSTGRVRLPYAAESGLFAPFGLPDGEGKVIARNLQVITDREGWLGPPIRIMVSRPRTFETP